MTEAHTLPLLASAMFLASACTPGPVRVINKVPEADLSGNSTTVTKGSMVTFGGKITDADDDTSDLTATWTIKDKNSNVLDLELEANCFEPPEDSANKQAAVACSFRAPTDIEEILVCLSGSDPRGTGLDAKLQVVLDPGGVPTCAISAPDPDPDDPFYAERDIAIDGTCSDVGGETAAADLALWFRTTYLDDENQTISEDFSPESDTGDTGGYAMLFETSGNEARLYGNVFLPAADHNLCLFARDESGNKNGDDTCISFTVKPPNTPPWCEIVQPADGATGGVGDSVYFAAQVGDENQGASSLYVEWSTNQELEPIGYGTPDSDGWVNIDVMGVFDEARTHRITLLVEDDERDTCTTYVDYTVGSGPYVEILYPDPLESYEERTFGLTEIIPFEVQYNDNETECGDLTVLWTYEPQDPEEPEDAVEKPFPGWDTDGDASCSSVRFYDPTSEDALADEDHYIIRVMVTDADDYSQTASTYLRVADCSQDWYLDLDGDGYGDPELVVSDCYQPSGYVSDNSDCDDYAVNVNPGEAETCNGQDDDCDGDIDEDFHRLTFYEDADGDGYGDDTLPYDADGDGVADLICATMTLPGWSPLPGDCDDSQPDINPGETELCDDIDHDCDGSTYNGFAYPSGTSWYEDADGDGYTSSTSTEACEQPSGYVLTEPDPLDCDDADASQYPGASELCDNLEDDNCDGEIDEPNAASCITAYLDQDGDGWGTLDTLCVCESNRGEYGADSSGDCDDADAAINPDATEICDPDDTDENCDGYSDIEGSSSCEDLYYDADGDDYYASGAGSRCLCEPDGDYGGHLPGDCNDSDAAISPDATEVCDTLNVDEDCDGAINDADSSVSGQDTWYEDADSDTYGNPSSTLARCYQPSGYVSDDTDCDDTSATTYPGATEYCDGIDSDCDGTVDEDDAEDVSTWYTDTDGDGYGYASSTDVACSAPSGYVADDSDCDDTSATTNPGATEYCDGHDDDCDGTVDEDDAADASTWYADADGDSYGDASSIDVACFAPSGDVADDTDCDDTSATTNPGATEYCDGHDDDCDGTVDEDDAADTSTWYADVDEDSYGAASSTDVACSAPSGYVSDDTDCDDTSATTYPGATEYCDGHDDDCDGTVDEDDAGDASTWYADADGDGYGYASSTDVACSAPSDYVADDTDCDDSNSSIHPGATETVGDGVDYDCDGTELCYDDDDNDGWLDTSGDTRASSDADCSDAYEGTSSDPTTDCNDANASIHPGVAETVGDGVDYDCDGAETCYDDDDNDGYLDTSGDTRSSSDTDCSDSYEGTTSDPTTDCNDSNGSIHPGATEICDYIDNDCDTLTDEGVLTTYWIDSDGDDYGNPSGSTTARCSLPSGYADNDDDCDDSYDLVQPGLVMQELVSVYSSSRKDHMTTVAGSSDYSSKISSGYSDASPSTVGYSVVTFPSGFDSSNYDEVLRGWSSGCTDHVTCISVSRVNTLYAHGCSTYTQDSISMGYLPDTDQGTYTYHWDRCWRLDRTNHRMTYESSTTCNDIDAAFSTESAVHYIFRDDLSCP